VEFAVRVEALHDFAVTGMLNDDNVVRLGRAPRETENVAGRERGGHGVPSYLI
jgi:hypothetical protein